MRRDACPLCDERTNINTTSSRTGSWLSIPAYKDRLEDWLTVFYFDLEQLRVPARYDSLLPMPSAEIAARLAKGEGLVVAHERRGAPPAILVAAPRWAQLASVEEALASMKSLPTEPTPVKLDPTLRPSEIRAVVRSAKKAMRQCFNDLTSRVPDAQGKVVLKFAIRDGAVLDATIETDSASLRDGPFEQCLLGATRALKFPVTGKDGKTTVAYPIVFANTDDH
jgi:hypothetical protein